MSGKVGKASFALLVLAESIVTIVTRLSISANLVCIQTVINYTNRRNINDRKREVTYGSREL